MSVFVLKKRSNFKDVTKKGQKFVKRPFIVFTKDWGVNSGDSFYGLIVTSKTGNAVERNRIKRRLRHLIMEVSTSGLLNGKAVCILAKRQSYFMCFSDLKRELESALLRDVEKSI